MEYDINFCCPGLESFIKYWENTNLDVGFGVINPPVEGEYGPFRSCPYCGHDIKKMINNPESKFDKGKKYIYEWDDKYSIGIPWIDIQHQKLLELINTLLDSIIKAKKIDEAGKLMKFLQNYTKAHFGTEENFMRKHEYPGYASHRKEHAKFIKTIDNFYDEYKSHGATSELIKKMANILWEWYKNHILGSDYAFGEYLKSQKFIYDNESATAILNKLLKGAEE